MAEEEKKDVEVKEEKKEETVAVDKKEEEKKEETTDVEVPSEFKKIIEEIEGMTVLQLHGLVKVLEAKFGVSAQAVAQVGGAGGDADAGEEKDSFTVELKSAGDKKIAVIKVVKEVLVLGLKEAKDMVDGAPTILKEGVKKEEADEIKAKIEEAGGTVELK